MNNVRLSTLSFTQLQYAVALARLGSFGKAARACGVSQPALSMQIQRLEQLFGGPLFDRSRQPVVPTDLGRALVEQGHVVLREAGRLGDLALEVKGVLAGELRLGVIPTLAPFLLPRFLPDFVARHPSLAVLIEEIQTPEILDALLEERLDAGLIASCPPGQGIASRALFTESFLGYFPPGHRLAAKRQIDVKQLRLDEMLLLAEGHCLRDQVIELCGGGKVREPAPGRLNFAGGSLDTLRSLVEQGCGVTLLPELSVKGVPARRGARLRPFKAPGPERTIYLVRHRVHLKSRPIDAFVAAMMKGLPVRKAET